jgi:hypothetical protein
VKRSSHALQQQPGGGQKQFPLVQSKPSAIMRARAEAKRPYKGNGRER